MRLLITLLIFGLWPNTGFALKKVELELEPPATRKLLEEAAKLLNRPKKGDDLWRAAGRFCEAARLGSIEAQYQLGMLYAFGEGVPAKPEVAAALFAQAAQQGHYEAQKMLETIPLGSAEQPACVFEAGRLPEKPVFTFALGDGRDIEQHIKYLPENKHWIIKLVKTMAPWYNIDARLALSIISVESNFETNAHSSANAMGLMQLIPETAERFNIKDAFNATQNLKGGLSYLRWLLARYQGDVALAAAGYNAGEGKVDQYNGVPPYPETQQYVKKVLSLYRKTKHPLN